MPQISEIIKYPKHQRSWFVNRINKPILQRSFTVKIMDLIPIKIKDHQHANVLNNYQREFNLRYEE